MRLYRLWGLWVRVAVSNTRGSDTVRLLEVEAAASSMDPLPALSTLIFIFYFTYFIFLNSPPFNSLFPNILPFLLPSIIINISLSLSIGLLHLPPNLSQESDSHRQHRPKPEPSLFPSSPQRRS